MVFTSRRAVIFVHGCFWHGHDCRFFRVPTTRPEFWLEKIRGNQRRDLIVREQLNQTGWRQLTIWECALRGKKPEQVERVLSRVSRWLDFGGKDLEIRGE